MNIIFVAESEPGVESPSLSPGRYRQPVYDRLDILPNNVPDSDVSMYNTCTLCTQSNCTTNVHDRLDIQPNNVHNSDVSMYTMYNICKLCALRINYVQCMYNMRNTCTIFPMHIQLCNTCTICAIYIQYVQYTYNLCNTFTIFAIHVHYVQYISTMYNTCTLCTTNEYDRLYIPNYTYSQYTQTVNKLMKTLQYLQTFYESVQNKT